MVSLTCPACDQVLHGVDIDHHVMSCPELDVSCPCLGDCLQFSVPREEYFSHVDNSLRHDGEVQTVTLFLKDDGKRKFRGKILVDQFKRAYCRILKIPDFSSVSFWIYEATESFFQWQPYLVSHFNERFVITLKLHGSHYYLAVLSDLKKQNR